jgi:hypothetical protein
MVDSDSGETYKVSLSSQDVLSCSCKGFAFRRQCKHSLEVKKLVEEEGIKAKIKPEEKSGFSYIIPYKAQFEKVLRDVL